MHRLQLQNFGYGMTATPVYANIMRVSPLAVPAWSFDGSQLCKNIGR